MGKRITVARGIYRNGADGTYEIRVIVGGIPYSDHAPKDSTPDERKAIRARLENQGRTTTPRAERGTLRAAVATYLKQIQHLASWKTRIPELKDWIKEYGDVYRHRISRADVLHARQKWLTRKKKPLAPKSVNHRLNTLRHLYHLLDGKRAVTPCDEIAPIPIPRQVIQRVTDATILAVDAKLQEHEADKAHTLRSAKTRARFRVLVSTGRRPSEIMRTQPADVNLSARVWIVRDGKGGYSPGIYLNDDMVAAWALFIEAKAWGKYNTDAFACTIRAAGWPATVRPYNARHTTWITASERGADLADIAAGAGHKDQRMTRKAYVPVLASRMQRLGELLEGRFEGFPVVPDRGTAIKPQKQARNRA